MKLARSAMQQLREIRLRQQWLQSSTVRDAADILGLPASTMINRMKKLCLK